jgi:hypothetical protein
VSSHAHFNLGNAAVLDRPVPVVKGDFAAATVTASKTENGGTLSGLRIFKTGTFTDAYGMEWTWEDAHLEQMVFHYKLLRDNDVLPNVPVRADHDRSVNSVIGYLGEVYREDGAENFLAADIEITEPDAWEKWERGTYRSRSLEIGMYETNNGAMYFPVVLGLAFVDLPAVEGLYGRSGRRSTAFSLVDDKEQSVAEETETPPEGQTPGQTEQTPPPEGQAPPAGPASGGGEAESTGNERPPAESQNPPQTAEGTGTPATQVHSFRLHGQATNDFAAVQRHIETLESTVREQVQAGRSAFVQTLASENKIAASQIEGMTALAQGMSDTQFAEFQKLYAEAPASSLFAQHAAGGGGTPTPAGAEGPSDVEIAEETVINHRRSGMPEDQVKATASYQKLVAAGKAEA